MCPGADFTPPTNLNPRAELTGFNLASNNFTGQVRRATVGGGGVHDSPNLGRLCHQPRSFFLSSHGLEGRHTLSSPSPTRPPLTRPHSPSHERFQAKFLPSPTSRLAWRCGAIGSRDRCEQHARGDFACTLTADHPLSKHRHASRPLTASSLTTPIHAATADRCLSDHAMRADR